MSVPVTLLFVQNVYIGGGSTLGVDRHVLGWHAKACAGMACQGMCWDGMPRTSMCWEGMPRPRQGQGKHMHRERDETVTFTPRVPKQVVSNAY
ncbi:hypothetical protein HanIR_Chr14g0670501 [Helianthus annuus]|nr:hypothetical protein HanIR_Chr14g0670501 [Helianthus annuus]